MCLRGCVCVVCVSECVCVPVPVCVSVSLADPEGWYGMQRSAVLILNPLILRDINPLILRDMDSSVPR
jgi:hypothetical protein